MWYDGAIMITNFNGMYYFESGILLPGYTNSMPYNHPLDQQGHIALTHHSGVAAYNSYIGLVTTGIPVTITIKDKKVCQFYTDLVGMVPDPYGHSIWGSLYFLPLVSNVFLSRYDSGTFLSHLVEGEYGFNHVGTNCVNLYQMYPVVPTLGWHPICRCGSSVSILQPTCGQHRRLYHLLEGFLCSLQKQHRCSTKSGLLPEEKTRARALMSTLTFVDLRRHCQFLPWSGGP